MSSHTASWGHAVRLGVLLVGPLLLQLGRIVVVIAVVFDVYFETHPRTSQDPTPQRLCTHEHAA